LRAKNRDTLQAHLKQNGIGSAVYYPESLHLQECFKTLGNKVGDFPSAEQAAREVLSIPIYPEITEEQKEFVVQTIASFYASIEKRG
jgi:dTDP-4-amino-4,6-dideoxygalactose transaminase